MGNLKGKKWISNLIPYTQVPIQKHNKCEKQRLYDFSKIYESHNIGFQCWWIGWPPSTKTITTTIIKKEKEIKKGRKEEQNSQKKGLKYVQGGHEQSLELMQREHKVAAEWNEKVTIDY